MRRVPFLAALLAVTAAAFVFGAAPSRAGGQEATPAAGSNFVGAWHLTTETPFGAQSLITFSADGTVAFSDRPSQSGGTGFPVTIISAGHGVWEQTGPDAAAATFVEVATDAEGTFVGLVTNSMEVTLGAGGDSWSGRFSSTTTDPAGAVTFVGVGTVQAARITVQPLATLPAGTPTA